MKFYQQRIPVYATHQIFLKATLLLCSIAASALARYERTATVVVVTALAGAFTSWTEFSDLGRKMQRSASATAPPLSTSLACSSPPAFLLRLLLLLLKRRGRRERRSKIKKRRRGGGG